MFAQIDLFGKPVSLNFNGKSKSRSSAGAWFTLIFFAFIGWAIYQLGQDLIYRIDPKTITSEFLEENPAPMTISPDTFNFAFGLQHPVTFAHYIDNSIYTVSATRAQQKRVIKEDGSVDAIWSSTILQLEICTKEHFGSHAQKFETIELNQLFCLKKNQPGLDEIRIQGVFESPIFENVAIDFRPCNNKTSQVPCAPKETIDDMLGGGWFATYFTNVAIEPKNYSYPNFGYRDSFYTSISNSYFKEITLWLSHIEVASDSGWVTKEVSTEKYIKLDRPQEYTSFRTNNDQMISFIIRVGKITTHYERSYIKVQDVVAKTNGFVSLGVIGGFIFLMPYSNIKFYERLINELFDVKTLRETRKIKKYNRKRGDKRGVTCLIVDGDKVDTSGQKDKGRSFEKNFSNFDSPPLSPGGENNGNRILSKGGTNRPNNGKIIDLNTPKHLSPFGHHKDSSFDEKNFNSMSSDIKDIKLLVAETSPHQKNEETRENQDTQNPEKTDKRLLSEPNFGSFSSKVNASPLLHDRPKITDMPQINNFETLEIQSPRESFMSLDNIVDKPKVKLTTNKDSTRAKNVLDISKTKEYELKVSKPRKINLNVDEEEITQRAQMIPGQLIKDSYQIEITFLEYVRSYFWKSKEMKEKFGLLNEGIRRIQERLNIFNLLKKLRELDKLKLLLLENEQFVLFDALPNPELSFKKVDNNNEKSFSTNQLKEAKFVAEKRKHDLVKYSYIDLKKKGEQTVIDEKLLEIYDDIIDS